MCKNINILLSRALHWLGCLRFSLQCWYRAGFAKIGVKTNAPQNKAQPRCKSKPKSKTKPKRSLKTASVLLCLLFAAGCAKDTVPVVATVYPCALVWGETNDWAVISDTMARSIDVANQLCENNQGGNTWQIDTAN